MELQPVINYSQYECVRVIDSHAEGMGARILVGGVPELKGTTMRDKINYFRDNYDYIRTATMCEPRGHSSIVGAVLTEPCIEEADYGLFYMEPPGFIDMCGHGTIATSTVLVNTGLVKVTEPITEIVYDTAAGIVRAEVKVKNGKAQSVTITNAPAYVLERNRRTEYNGKTIEYDVVYGGNKFIMIKVDQFELAIGPDTIHQLKAIHEDLVGRICDEVNADKRDYNLVEEETGLEFYGASPTEGCDARNVVICGSLIDRSPCGTGTSAKLALLYDEGLLEPGMEYVNESFIGSKFIGRIAGITEAKGHTAVIPQVSGCGYITGEAVHLLDSDDPFRNGFYFG